MRYPRKPEPTPDLSRFDALVLEAVEAFGCDVSYGVAMSRNACEILRRRAVWDGKRMPRRAAAKPAVKAPQAKPPVIPIVKPSSIQKKSTRTSRRHLDPAERAKLVREAQSLRALGWRCDTIAEHLGGFSSVTIYGWFKERPS